LAQRLISRSCGTSLRSAFFPFFKTRFCDWLNASFFFYEEEFKQGLKRLKLEVSIGSTPHSFFTGKEIVDIFKPKKSRLAQRLILFLRISRAMYRLQSIEESRLVQRLILFLLPACKPLSLSGLPGCLRGRAISWSAIEHFSHYHLLVY